MTNSDFHRSAESAVEHLQARGRHYDIIREAIAAYDEYMLDDDYDAQRTLDSIIKRMRERTALTDAPVIQSEKVTEQQIEDGAKALFGEGWDKTATPANRRYCREKAKAIFAAMAAQPTDKIQSTTPAQPEKVSKDALAVATYIEELTTPRMIDLLLDRNDREIVIAALKTYAAQPPAAPVETEEDWREDPSSDERWNAGLDYGMVRFCACLGVDPKDVRWDAATEELDGDVCAVIGNILRVKFGENFDPDSVCRSSAGNVTDKEQVVRLLRQHLKVGGHEAWEGSYHYVTGIDEAAAAVIAALAQPQAARVTPADNLVAQIETRFPNWRSYRDLIDCIDCTLHQLRGSK